MNKEVVRKIEWIHSNRIVTTEKGKYFLKKQKHYEQKRVYKLLEERGFEYFLKPLTVLSSKEEVFSFIKEKQYHSEEKAIDMMHVLSLLQNKTTFYKEISLDEIKEIYEKNKEELQYLYNYYEDLEERFFKEVYPSPTVYLFQRNISLLFESLSFSRNTLEKWYEKMIQKKRSRMVLVHHKFVLSHLLEAEIPRLISLDQLQYGLPIEDLLTFFKEHCLEQDLEMLFSIHQKKYPFQEEEFLLFSSLLAKPDKLEIQNSSCFSCKELSIAFQKLNRYRLFLLHENEKQKKQNH